jgi:hypothetical protein
MEEIKVEELNCNSRRFQIQTNRDRDKLILQAWEWQGEKRTRLKGIIEEVCLRDLDGLNAPDPSDMPNYNMALASIRYNLIVYAYTIT